MRLCPPRQKSNTCGHLHSGQAFSRLSKATMQCSQPDLRWDKGFEAVLLPLLHALTLLLLLVCRLARILLRLRQEVLPRLQLQIHLAGLLGGWEGGVLRLLDNDRLLALNILLLKLGQKAFPVFCSQIWILGQLTLDHEGLDVVDGMDILDAVLNNSPHLQVSLSVSAVAVECSMQSSRHSILCSLHVQAVCRASCLLRMHTAQQQHVFLQHCLQLYGQNTYSQVCLVTSRYVRADLFDALV